MARKKEATGLFARLDQIVGDDSAKFKSVQWWLNTGCDLLNWAIHPEGSGYPGGRTVEIYGPWSSGKTMLALTGCRNVQQMGGLPCYVDIEGGLDKGWAEKLGVNTDTTSERFWYGRPDTLEQALACVETIVDEREAAETPTLIVLDSIAMAGTAAASERNTLTDSQAIGDKARLLSSWFANKGIPRRIFNTKIIFMILNQTREKIGVLFGSPETRPGGNAIPFASWASLRVGKGKEILTSDRKAVGYFMDAKVVKNKVGPPKGKCSFPVYWKGGIDNANALIIYMQNEKIVPAEGLYITWGGQKITKRKLREQMLADRELYEEVRQLCRKHMIEEME